MGAALDPSTAGEVAKYILDRRVEKSPPDDPEDAIREEVRRRKVLRLLGIDEADLEEKALETPWKMRLARQAVPYPVAALLYAGAEVAAATGGALVAGAAYLTAAVAWWTVWSKRNPENRVARRRYATTVGVAGTAWMVWASAKGVPAIAVDALVLGTAAAAAPYWRRNTIPIPPDPMEIEPAPVIEVKEASWVVQRWDEVVADANGALPGSFLTDPQEPAEGTERYTIQMRGGKHTTQTAIAAVSRIASAFGLGMDRVSVEPYPTGDQSKAILTVAINNPLAVTSFYPGPLAALDMTGGGIRSWIGKRADGSDVWWDFFRPDWGTCGGVVIGGTGSGKSKFLSQLITSAAYSKLITPLPACPQGGSSFPLWMKYGHWPAPGPEAIMLQARAIDRALTRRSQLNTLREVEIHVPTEAEPILLWVLDECHQMFKKASDEIVVIADRVARQGRKAGIALIPASQYPGLETFGNKDSLRNSLLAGNGISLRIDTRDAKQMLPGLVGNPVDLPKFFPDGKPTSGLGLVVGENPSPFRAGLVKEQKRLAAEAPRGTVEPITAAAMGSDYLERHTRILTSRAELAAELDMHDPELVAAITQHQPELAEMMRKIKARGPATRTIISGASAPTAPRQTEAAHLAPAPVLRLPDAAPALATTKHAPTAADLIWRLLSEGVTEKKELMRLSGKGETQVRNTLNAFIAEGKVRNSGWGRYERVA